MGSNPSSRVAVPVRPLSAEPAALKGRGTAWAIEHRFTVERHERVDDGWGSLEQEVGEELAAPDTEIIEQRVKTILTGNDSPDINFDLSINPYRGCEHGCIYCFARPTHSYFNLSPGLDFETKIFAKVNAAERLRAALLKPGYHPLLLNIGSATDAYQPAERRLGITRSVIEVLREFEHPFSVITKSSGIERDIDLIAPMAAQRMAAAYVSVTTLDSGLARILEPRAATPARRLKTIERLARAGIPVGVSASPMIPFINEPELERILEAAARVGATSAFSIVVRLPWEVNPLFQQWLEAHFPDRAKRVMARIRDMRGGKDNDSRFGQRMRGEGLWADLLRQRFHKAASRLGLLNQRTELDLSRFRRSAAAPRGRVVSLWEGHSEGAAVIGAGVVTTRAEPVSGADAVGVVASGVHIAGVEAGLAGRAARGAGGDAAATSVVPADALFGGPTPGLFDAADGAAVEGLVGRGGRAANGLKANQLGSVARRAPPSKAKAQVTELEVSPQQSLF